MAGSMRLAVANGKGKCALCDQVIAKDRPIIVYEGYNTSTRCHALPWDCKALAGAALEARGTYMTPEDIRDLKSKASS